MLSIIPDGYDKEPGFIRALPGVHPDVRFTYRPALPEEQSELLERFGKESRPVYDRRCAAFLADRIRTWSIEDTRTTPATPWPINAKNILRLRPQLFIRLYEIVSGLGSTDIDPDWPDEDQVRMSDQQFESAVSGSTPAVVAQEANQKN